MKAVFSPSPVTVFFLFLLVVDQYDLGKGEWHWTGFGVAFLAMVLMIWGAEERRK